MAQPVTLDYEQIQVINEFADFPHLIVSLSLMLDSWLLHSLPRQKFNNQNAGLIWQCLVMFDVFCLIDQLRSHIHGPHAIGFQLQPIVKLPADIRRLRIPTPLEINLA